MPPIKSYIAQRIPPSIKPTARRIYHLPVDVLNSLLGRRDPLTPSKGRVFFGGGDFNQVGEEYLRYFVELGGLEPHERVLDVGCGIGRMAVPLTRYLDDRGSYEGIDVFPKGIAWCQENITPRYPNFRFRVAEIKNKEYNPGGRFSASEYEFPYADASFDFVLLTSVFTHLLSDEVENYLSEIERVLAPGGRCFASFFLLNEESLALLRSGRSTIDCLPETPPSSKPHVLVSIRPGAQDVGPVRFSDGRPRLIRSRLAGDVVRTEDELLLDGRDGSP